jgi:hypothetical protein
MPFAKKFRAMMDIPLAGDTLDTFTAESVNVRDERTGAAGYTYDVAIVLRGLGGKQGVKMALKGLLDKHVTTFSAYGNAYQLWFRNRSLDVESLGDKRYAVSVKGAGERVALSPELGRFLEHLEASGMLSSSAGDKEELVAEYLDRYQLDVRRQVGRYDYRLRRKQPE